MEYLNWNVPAILEKSESFVICGLDSMWCYQLSRIATESIPFPDKDSLYYAIFRNSTATSIHNNNINEIIGRRHQGVVATEVQG